MKFNWVAWKSVAIGIIASLIVAGLASIGLDVAKPAVEEGVRGTFEILEDRLGGEAGEAAAEPATVLSVIDGDTIRVRRQAGDTTVRLIGINTPEVAGSPAGAECYGAEATAAVKTLLPNGTALTLTTDTTQALYDKHDRLLAYVTLADGRDIGEELLRGGFAHEFTYSAPYLYQTRYIAAETDARMSTVGLWSACAEGDR